MKLLLVCQHCTKATKSEDEAAIEINFADAQIHFLCPKCGKMNKVQLRKPDVPLARSRRA